MSANNHEALGHMEELDGRAARCEPGHRKRMEPCWDAARLPSRLPGVSELSATAILSEAGAGMDVSGDAGQLRGWCGLVPGDSQPDGKKKSTRTARAGQYLKPLLARCALAAVRPAQEDYFAIKHGRPGQRRGHKKATVAIARKTVVRTCHMPRSGEASDPHRPREAEEPQAEARAAHGAVRHRAPEGTRLRNSEGPGGVMPLP